MIRETLVYDDTPPSLNTTGTRGSHWVTTKLKQRWQRIFEGLLLSGSLPRDLSQVDVTASLRFPVKRERDEGNYRWLLEKALGDALVNGGWLRSDSADRFRVGRVDFEPERGPARTTLQISGRFR